MSIKVIGKITFENLSIKEQIFLSFKIVKLAAENNIGILMGANSFKSEYDIHPNENSIELTLTDDPLDNNCEYLFSGNGVCLTTFGIKEERNESLEERMIRVQKFLANILEIENVIHIVLEIDYDIQRFDPIINIDVSDFQKIMLKLYMDNSNIAPCIKLIIHNQRTSGKDLGTVWGDPF